MLIPSPDGKLERGARPVAGATTQEGNLPLASESTVLEEDSSLLPNESCSSPPVKCSVAATSALAPKPGNGDAPAAPGRAVTSEAGRGSDTGVDREQTSETLRWQMESSEVVGTMPSKVENNGFDCGDRGCVESEAPSPGVEGPKRAEPTVMIAGSEGNNAELMAP